jgi:hypothetical protein
MASEALGFWITFGVIAGVLAIVAIGLLVYINSRDH